MQILNPTSNKSTNDSVIVPDVKEIYFEFANKIYQDWCFHKNRWNTLVTQQETWAVGYLCEFLTCYFYLAKIWRYVSEIICNRKKRGKKEQLFFYTGNFSRNRKLVVNYSYSWDSKHHLISNILLYEINMSCFMKKKDGWFLRLWQNCYF